MVRTVAKIGLILSLIAVSASANTIYFDTLDASLWQVTAFASVWPGQPNSTTGQAYSIGGNKISLSSNGFESGTYVGGKTSNAFLFDGFWTATYYFDLPSYAVLPSLSFLDLTGNDRLVLQLNGNTIGQAALNPTPNGKMAFTDSEVNHEQPLSFAGATSSGTVSTASYFHIGGHNTLTLIVNNTPNGIATARTYGFPDRLVPDSTDATWAAVAGQVDFATPEPASISLLLVGLIPLALRYRKNRA